MVRASLVGIAMAAFAGCHHPAAKVRSARVSPQVAMDSAEIERVCAQPDSVRAARVDCVLKDQSRPQGVAAAGHTATLSLACVPANVALKLTGDLRRRAARVVIGLARSLATALGGEWAIPAEVSLPRPQQRVHASRTTAEVLEWATPPGCLRCFTTPRPPRRHVDSIHTTRQSVIAFALGATSFLTTACHAPRPAARRAPSDSTRGVRDLYQRDVDSAAAAFMRMSHAAGMSVVVVTHGPRGTLAELVYNFGRVARDGGPITDSTIFEIGSETKVFTGTLLALLAREGVVVLRDPLQRYLPAGVRAPEFRGAPITLRDLATHRSGLPRMPANIDAGPNGRAQYSLDSLYSFLDHYRLTRAPGERYEYSNVAYGLLGSILARVAGKPYEGLVVDRVARPLGMGDTRITLSASQLARRATGYWDDATPAPEWANTGAIAGGGGLHSTPSDMGRFLAANLAPARTTLGAALEDAQTLHLYATQPEHVTGLGWERQLSSAARGETLLAKNGATAGFASWMGLIRADTIALAVLVNNTSVPPDGFAAPLLRLLANIRP